ncbi:ROK family protein [haloarchaeon 3A1-DGR]|nr:ROK family protein [haloarchaeon 3A1-DGR]
MMHFVGVDLGASNVRAAVGDRTGEIRATARARTPAGPTGAAVTDAVREVVTAACSSADVDPTDVAGAGVASMGRLDLAAGAVASAPNVDADVGPIRLVGPLASLLDLDRDAVTLRSDTQAGAVGERFHAHPDVEDLVYLTISSGIGAGVIADGEPLTGRDANAGEVGHITIAPEGGMTCGCGREGHWEAYCSGNNVPRFARALHERDPVDTAVPLADEGFDAADVYAHAGTDAFADRVLERVTALNVRGAAAVVHAYAPRVLVVGGAVATNNPETVVEPIRRRLPGELVVDAPEVTLAELGDDAALAGALVLAIPDADRP